MIAFHDERDALIIECEIRYSIYKMCQTQFSVPVVNDQTHKLRREIRDRVSNLSKYLQRSSAEDGKYIRLEKNFCTPNTERRTTITATENLCHKFAPC